MAIRKRTRFGHFVVLDRIGSGGMGEVYEAKDTRLGRKVALKVLRDELTKDENRLRRFIQEAKAASALNHPNILTVYEVGNAGTEHFIATELVEGMTLRQRIGNSRISLQETLNISVQVASALGAAHGAGVVHRDLKPENIMVRSDGYVKVLDFGLAKLIQPSVLGDICAGDSEVSTISKIDTEPGVVLGTVRYMSPEQTRGLAVDGRSDIFSLGVVIYEMMTGCAPFEGSTASDIIVAILAKEPPPMARYSNEVPAELEWIVSKALAKDRDDRYQTVKDLVIDLKMLKHRREVGIEREDSFPPRTSGQSVDPERVAMAAIDAVSVAPEATGSSGRNSNDVSATAKPHSLRRRIAISVMSLTALLALGYGAYRYLNGNVIRQPAAFETMKMIRLTSSGKAYDAAISPDGKYVAYVVDEAGSQSLWVRQVASTTSAQIVPPAEADYGRLTFSIDSNFVYYRIYAKHSRTATLYQVSVLGGPPRTVLKDIDSPISFSPDGKRFAFVRNQLPQKSALILASADGANEEELAARIPPDVWGLPSWSPDGKSIACTTVSLSSRGQSLIEVRADSKAETPITRQRWRRVERLAWLSDGSGLALSGADKDSGLFQLWLISYPTGEARRATNDLNNYKGISLTSDSRSLVTVLTDQLASMWTVPNGDTSRAKELKSNTGSGKDDGANGISWTPDGDLVFVSRASGASDIWLIDSSTGDQRRLTFDPHEDVDPVVSSEGRYIIFVSDRAGSFNVWRMDIDGGSPKQLTFSEGERHPHCSPDGKWIVFEGYVSGIESLWRAPIDGGDAVRLTEGSAWRPAFSPDGKLIACVWPDLRAQSQYKIAVLPFEGGQPIKTFDTPIFFPQVLRWSRDGRALRYVSASGGVSNIWSQPLNGHDPKRLTDFTTGEIFSVGWSSNGKDFACSRGSESSDVVLITEFK